MSLRSAADFGSILSLAKLLRRVKADIIHAHNGRETWIAVFAALLARQGKVVVTRHTVDPAKKSLLHAWLYTKVAKFICVSEITKTVFLNGTSFPNEKKVVVVRNGINTKGFVAGAGSDTREKLCNAKTDKIIGYIGKYDSSKGIEVLIQATAILVKKMPNIKVLMVGTSQKGMEHYEEKLNQLIENLGLKEYIILHGFSADVNPLIDAMDIVTLPSITPESCGLVLLEGMAASKPVVTTSNGGQAEYIEHNVSGILVSPSSPDELASAIFELIANPHKAHQLGQAGNRIVNERFRLDKMVENTLGVFHSCL